MINNIKKDLENGLTYKAIMEKYNLKSNYLIKKAKGIRQKEYKYITINISPEQLQRLDDYKFSTVAAYVYGMSKIMHNKSLYSLWNVIKEQAELRDQLSKEEE